LSGAFWDFTVAAYGRPGVGPAVIGLQNRRRADVNLLFYACWAGCPLDATAFRAADAAVASWRGKVVEPLRAVRDAIRAGIPGAPAEAAGALRKTVLGAEIEGERIAQAILESLPRDGRGADDGLATAAANLAVYLAAIGAMGEEDRAAVRTLLATCFAGATAAALDGAAARVVPA
jgi:uncharacterized protein (TIGR02444 family)